jgi:Bucentaur or craniofacial development
MFALVLPNVHVGYSEPEIDCGQNSNRPFPHLLLLPPSSLSRLRRDIALLEKILCKLILQLSRLQAEVDSREILDVPEDSKDVKIWPLADRISNGTSTHTSTDATPVASTSASVIPETVVSATSTSGTSRRPGPRKSKTVLPPLPSSSSQRTKNLSTLDKSAMDWRAHLNTNEDLHVKDQLEANRRAGGYLDKVEFLQRVEKRKGDVLDANKSSKRRR